MADNVILQLNNVESAYGPVKAIRGVSLKVSRGSIVTVLGANGAGKSTILKTISGIIDPQKGSILYRNEPIQKKDPAWIVRQGIAHVPEGREIFPLLTVKENLETGYAPVPRRERYIPDYIFDLFPVLKDMLGRRGGDLSGGQQQQLAIGRALVTRPRLLVLDEPTEGIQPSIIKDIGRAIEWLRQQGTMAILLVEQYFDFAHELADTFAVMDRGEIVVSGTQAEMGSAEVRAHLTV